MIRHKTQLMLMASAILLPLVFGSAYAEKPAEPKAEVKNKKEELPIQELRAFAEVFGRIKNDYVEKVSDKTLIEHAIK